MKSAILSILFLAVSFNAYADLGITGGLDPISVVCANDDVGTDGAFSVQIQKDGLEFFPYEGSFTVYEQDFFAVPLAQNKHLFMFERARVNLFQEGVESKALASGSILTNGHTAEVQYDLNGGAVVHQNLRCHQKQTVRVNLPTKETKAECFTSLDQACLYMPGAAHEYVALVDSSAVKPFDLTSRAACSAEGATCLVLNMRFFKLKVPHVETLIWE